MGEGGRLEIRVGREDKNFVSVTITDNGSGIPQKDLERLFEPFFSPGGKKVGTGLGLSITYGLVQEIGGRISVQSDEGKGTSFIIVFPLKMEDKKS